MLHQLNVADGEEVAQPAKFMPPNGKPYALNLFNNMIYTHTAQGCGGNPNIAYVYDLATKKVGTWGPAGGGMWGRTGPAISANGTMYTGTGDGRWDPENGIYGNGIVGLKPDPKTKIAAARRLLRPLQRRVAGEARSRYAGHARHLQLQGQGTDGGRWQGMPRLPDGYRIDRRRRSSHAALSQSPALQRRGQLRLGRHLGIDGELGRCQGHPLGADADLGTEAFGLQSAASRTAR